MRAVIQRVHQARVDVEGKTVGQMGPCLVVFLGVGREDRHEDCDYIAGKIAGLRIFEDAAGLMNLSVQDCNGSILAISQFTLYGDCRKGRRPGFSEAALPDKAEKLYEEFADLLKSKGVTVKRGIFGADMQVSLVNDGPVTIFLER